jgi:hypothetical protein
MAARLLDGLVSCRTVAAAVDIPAISPPGLSLSA